MKNNNKDQYTAQAKGTRFAVEGDDPTIKASFATYNPRTREAGEVAYEGPLSALKDWAIQHQVSHPKGCTINGERHGLYPALDLNSLTAMQLMGLSVLRGYVMPEGDQLLYPGRIALRKELEALRAGGLPVDNVRCDWMVTDRPFSPKQAEVI